jgi:hypothetical protein
MCEYCKNIDTGNDYHPIIEAKLPLGFAGNILADVVLSRASPADPYPLMSLMAITDGGHDEFVQSIEIKYCPMCGRKLN